MREGLLIGPAELSPRTRRRVDRDAWLLSMWWIVVGIVATLLLHRVAGVRSPLWRYPLTAVVVYLLGDVVALRAWLALFARAARADPARWRVASDDERSSASALDVSRLTFFVAAAFAALIVAAGVVARVLRIFYAEAVLVTIVLTLGVLSIAGAIVRSLPSMLSGPTIMAELSIDFVFGRSVGREVLPARPQRESWAFIVRETWPAGVALLVLAIVVGATLMLVWPDAESLLDPFR